MALTARDIVMNADLFRSAYPHWPHPEPERSPVVEAWRIRPGDTVTLPVFPGSVTVTDTGLGSRYESTRLEWEAPGGMSGALDLPDFTPVTLVATEDGANKVWLGREGVTR